MNEFKLSSSTKMWRWLSQKLCGFFCSLQFFPVMFIHGVYTYSFIYYQTVITGPMWYQNISNFFTRAGVEKLVKESCPNQKSEPEIFWSQLATDAGLLEPGVAMASPDFEGSIHPISTRGTDYAHHNTTAPLPLCSNEFYANISSQRQVQQSKSLKSVL